MFHGCFVAWNHWEKQVSHSRKLKLIVFLAFHSRNILWAASPRTEVQKSPTPPCHQNNRVIFPWPYKDLPLLWVTTVPSSLGRGVGGDSSMCRRAPCPGHLVGLTSRNQKPALVNPPNLFWNINTFPVLNSKHRFVQQRAACPSCLKGLFQNLSIFLTPSTNKKWRVMGRE